MSIRSLISEAIQVHDRYEDSARLYVRLLGENPLAPRYEILETVQQMTGTMPAITVKRVNALVADGRLAEGYMITKANLFEADGEWQDGSNNPSGFGTAEPFAKGPKKDGKAKKKKGDDGEDHEAYDKHVFKADTKTGRVDPKSKDQEDDETDEGGDDEADETPDEEKDEHADKKPNPFAKGGKDKGGDAGGDDEAKGDGEDKPKGKFPSFKKGFAKKKDDDAKGEDGEDDDVEEKGSRTSDTNAFAQGDERDAQDPKGENSPKSGSEGGKDDIPIGKTVVLINPKEKDDDETNDEDDPSNKKVARKQ